MIRTVRAALPQIAAPLKEAFATIAAAAKTGISPAVTSLIELANGFRDITNTLAPSFKVFFQSMPGIVQAGIGAIKQMSTAFANLGSEHPDESPGRGVHHDRRGGPDGRRS